MSVTLPTSVERTAQNESIAETVIWAVAEAKDVDPLELGELLYDAIDPDALEQLFSGETDGSFERRVVFTLAGCDVTVSGDQRVVVRAPAETTSGPSASAIAHE
ncbi:HalOD1 output domain-containing protein [Halostella pelagica]|uniref:HalOD1 output domain-containing protein n=1 Tax=Halostella pelagica TaxID=2583824 RepID=UPI001386E72A|nr:HalOD1 output domain-containing protein [Halostella pelagica]